MVYQGDLPMSVEKIDKSAREMLKYLNINRGLTSATLAEAFNQNYSGTLSTALATLSYLESKGFVRMKTDNNEHAVLIQLTHLGIAYEDILRDQEKDERKKKWSERRWNILTLLLSAIISIIINLWFS